MTTCPHHPGKILMPEMSHLGALLVCPNTGCSYAVSANRPDPTAINAMPAESRGQTPEPAGDSDGAVERLLVARIKAKLEADGYKVLRVGQYRPDRGSGNDLGVPDLSCRHPSWGRGVAVWLEVKTTTGRVRKRQQELFDDGWSFIVRNETEAQAALATLEATNG